MAEGKRLQEISTFFFPYICSSSTISPTHSQSIIHSRKKEEKKTCIATKDQWCNVPPLFWFVPLFSVPPFLQLLTSLPWHLITTNQHVRPCLRLWRKKWSVKCSMILAMPPSSFDYISMTVLFRLIEIYKCSLVCTYCSKYRRKFMLWIWLFLIFYFWQGCDGSILLDDTISLQGEKEASTNVHSLEGYSIIDRIKNKLESECPGTVSCADILTIAARDAVIFF